MVGVCLLPTCCVYRRERWECKETKAPKVLQQVMVPWDRRSIFVLNLSYMFNYFTRDYYSCDHCRVIPDPLDQMALQDWMATTVYLGPGAEMYAFLISCCHTNLNHSVALNFSLAEP